MPGWFGVAGYVGGLALITAGYALFQAANNTGAMAGAGKGQRGLVSALLGLARNLGLITGASVMGAVFASAQHGLSPLGIASGSGLGLLVTFSVATVLALVAMGIVTIGNRRRGAAER